MREKGKKSNKMQNEQNTGTNASILKGSYTQIMVNPTQLSEHEFTNWMEKLMEAQKTDKRGRNIHTEVIENHITTQNKAQDDHS